MVARHRSAPVYKRQEDWWQAQFGPPDTKISARSLTRRPVQATREKIGAVNLGERLAGREGNKMKVLSLACAGLCFGLLSLHSASPAEALTISNADSNPHTITVTIGGDSKELTVAPDQEVDAGCSEGCKVKLENGEEYDLKGTEAVSIEDGVIFVDSSPDADDEDIPDIDPDAEPAAAAPGDATPPAESAPAEAPAQGQ
jgi:hypothetical protein